MIRVRCTVNLLNCRFLTVGSFIGRTEQSLCALVLCGEELNVFTTEGTEITETRTGGIGISVCPYLRALRGLRGEECVSLTTKDAKEHEAMGTKLCGQSAVHG